jgi:hypothetical protein
MPDKKLGSRKAHVLTCLDENCERKGCVERREKEHRDQQWRWDRKKKSKQTKARPMSLRLGSAFLSQEQVEAVMKRFDLRTLKRTREFLRALACDLFNEEVEAIVLRTKEHDEITAGVELAKQQGKVSVMMGRCVVEVLNDE